VTDFSIYGITVKQWLIALGLFAGFFLLGYGVERLVLSRLRRWTLQTAWKFDDVLVNSLSGMIIPVFLLGGLRLSLAQLPLTAELIDGTNKALILGAILLVTVFVARLALAAIARWTGKDGAVLPSLSLVSNIVRIGVYVAGFLMMLQALGLSITPMLTALGVGGLAVALALQETLANLFAGIHLLMSRQVKLGDYVRFESGEEGYITDITWRNTTIRGLHNHIVIIPNSKLASALITNFNMPDTEVGVPVSVGVSYDSDLQRVEAVTLEVAREVMRYVPGGLPEFEPFVRYQEFGDSSIDFTVMMRSEDFYAQYLVRHEFIKRLHVRYNQEGIEIPFPIRTVRIVKE